MDFRIRARLIATAALAAVVFSREAEVDDTRRTAIAAPQRSTWLSRLSPRRSTVNHGAPLSSEYNGKWCECRCCPEEADFFHTCRRRGMYFHADTCERCTVSACATAFSGTCSETQGTIRPQCLTAGSTMIELVPTIFVLAVIVLLLYGLFPELFRATAPMSTRTVVDALDDEVEVPTIEPPRPTPSATGLSPFELFVIQFDIKHIGVSIGCVSVVLLWKSLAVSYRLVKAPKEIYILFWYFTVALTIAIFTIYLYRCVRYPDLLRMDFEHNVATNMFGGVGIICEGLILATPPHAWNLEFAETWFFILCAYQVVLAVFWYADWLFKSQHTVHRVQALYFMAVINFFILGNVGAKVGRVELAAFLFMVGALFWMLIFIAMFSFFSKALAGELESPSPTLFLFIAPPAVAAMAWMNISRARGESPMNDVVRFWSAMDGLFYLMLIRLAPVFVRIRFNIGCWAYVFPTGAAAGLAVELTRVFDASLLEMAAAGMAGVCCIMAGIMWVLTVRAVRTGRIPHNPAAVRRHCEAVAAREAPAPATPAAALLSGGHEPRYSSIEKWSNQPI